MSEKRAAMRLTTSVSSRSTASASCRSRAFSRWLISSSARRRSAECASSSERSSWADASAARCSSSRSFCTAATWSSPPRRSFRGRPEAAPRPDARASSAAPRLPQLGRERLLRRGRDRCSSRRDAARLAPAPRSLRAQLRAAWRSRSMTSRRRSSAIVRTSSWRRESVSARSRARSRGSRPRSPRSHHDHPLQRSRA